MVTGSSSLRATGGLPRSLTLGSRGISRRVRKLARTFTVIKKKKKKKTIELLGY